MKDRLILGIVNVVVGLALVVTCVILNRTERVAFAFFPVAIGLGNIAYYISGRRKHKRLMAELARKCGIKDEE